MTGKLKIKVIANLLFSPNNVITTQVNFHSIWFCLKRPHSSYCFFVILSLITDQFLASLMVIFRILSLISCHFEAWGYFFIASKQTARPGSRPCIISSRNCFLSLFSWSSGNGRRVVPPGLCFYLPLVVFFRFLLTVVSNSSEMSPMSSSIVPNERLFLPSEVEAWDILSELSATSRDLAWSVLSWTAVSLSLTKQLLISQMKSICFYVNDFVLVMLYKVPLLCFREFWKATRRARE